jgi:hypothetical protein
MTTRGPGANFPYHPGMGGPAALPPRRGKNRSLQDHARDIFRAGTIFPLSKLRGIA